MGRRSAAPLWMRYSARRLSLVRSLSLIVIVEMTFYTESVCTNGLALLLEDSDSGYRISIERQGEIHTRL